MKKIIALLLALACVSTAIFADGYLLLEVDGIKVTVEGIQFGTNYNSPTFSGYLEVESEINITDDPNDVFNNSISLQLDSDTDLLEFDFISVGLKNGVSIKGHAYDTDGDVHIYTTSSGIQTVDTGGATWSEPGDYGYLSNSYMYYSGDSGTTSETTFMPAEVSFDLESGLEIQLLIDSYKLAYYWDGQDATRHGFVNSWHSQDSSLFPTGTAAVGISYIPFYVAVNRNVVSETYVVATDNSHLSGLTNDVMDEKNSMVVTLVFDADTGEFYSGRTANWDDLDDSALVLAQFIRSASESGGSYDLTLSEYSDGSGWTNMQTISGFVRSNSVGDTGTATVESTDPDYTLYYYRVD